MPEFLLNFSTNILVGPDYTDIEPNDFLLCIVEAPDQEAAEALGESLCAQAAIDHPGNYEESTEADQVDVKATELARYLHDLRTEGNRLILQTNERP